LGSDEVDPFCLHALLYLDWCKELIDPFPFCRHLQRYTSVCMAYFRCNTSRDFRQDGRVYNRSRLF
jgi:hypothetical protein